jgi:hypothetical protein
MARIHADRVRDAWIGAVASGTQQIEQSGSCDSMGWFSLLVSSSYVPFSFLGWIEQMELRVLIGHLQYRVTRICCCFSAAGAASVDRSVTV